MTYGCHGNFKLELVGNVLFQHLSGAWNKENALEYSQQVSILVSPIVNQPWALLNIITEWELATPDCEPIIKSILEIGVDTGLTCEAVVNANGTVKIEQLNRTLPVNRSFKRAFFTYDSDALNWLTEMGFECEKTPTF